MSDNDMILAALARIERELEDIRERLLVRAERGGAPAAAVKAELRRVVDLDHERLDRRALVRGFDRVVVADLDLLRPDIPGGATIEIGEGIDYERAFNLVAAHCRKAAKDRRLTNVFQRSAVGPPAIVRTVGPNRYSVEQTERWAER